MMTDMFLQIDNIKAGKYAFALTGRRLSIHFIPRVERSGTLGVIGHCPCALKAQKR